MLPEITVHKPTGVLPKLAVRQRRVIDYQPSWLLLAVPAVLALRARRKKSSPPRQTLAPQEFDSIPGASDGVHPYGETPVPRRRTRQVIIVPLARLRRRPGARIDLDEAARTGRVPTPATSLS